jgi:hypothetical protein
MGKSSKEPTEAGAKGRGLSELFGGTNKKTALFKAAHLDVITIGEVTDSSGLNL